ncbi:hypothetical protein [Salaquimonas pukyongi]|uniref:hypothetical protein n=1 Tax=Salaquimonas pukyongi TaxID=2712698 RepID=UPI0012EBEECC|nr:hypothetical protein [Salaquimonas pukyongi]
MDSLMPTRLIPLTEGVSFLVLEGLQQIRAANQTQLPKQLPRYPEQALSDLARIWQAGPWLSTGGFKPMAMRHPAGFDGFFKI